MNNADITTIIGDNANQDINCHAWCHELKRAVSASEIWNLLYNDVMLKDNPTFKCIDDHCHARLILRNCQPYLLAEEARFRLYAGQSHHHSCTYVQQQRHLKNLHLNQRHSLRQKYNPLLRIDNYV